MISAVFLDNDMKIITQGFLGSLIMNLKIVFSLKFKVCFFLRFYLDDELKIFVKRAEAIQLQIFEKRNPGI